MLRRLRTGAVCVVLLALLVGVRALIVDPDALTAPIDYTGSAEEPLDAERFTIDVRGVEFARAVTEGDGEEALPTDEVWMLIEVSLTAATESISIHAPVELATGSGLSYAASGELTSALSGGGGWALKTSNQAFPSPVSSCSRYRLNASPTRACG